MADDLAPEFVRVVPESREIDRAAVLKALKAGADVPGCELAQSTSLRIR